MNRLFKFSSPSWFCVVATYFGRFLSISFKLRHEFFFNQKFKLIKKDTDCLIIYCPYFLRNNGLMNHILVKCVYTAKTAKCLSWAWRTLNYRLNFELTKNRKFHWKRTNLIIMTWVCCGVTTARSILFNGIKERNFEYFIDVVETSRSLLMIS